MPLKDSGGHVVSDEYQWVTADVRIPQVLLDAHREGRVVFFIGAGASMPAPSNLPSFQALAEFLGKESGVPYETSENGIPEPIDRFLGRLTHLQPPYEVHKRTHAILTASESRPNDLHRAIVAYSQTARRPAKPLVRAHLRKAVNKAHCKPFSCLRKTQNCNDELR